MPATFVFQPADTDLAQNGYPQFIGIKRFHCKILLFVAHKPAPAWAQERDWDWDWGRDRDRDWDQLLTVVKELKLPAYFLKN